MGRWGGREAWRFTEKQSTTHRKLRNDTVSQQTDFILLWILKKVGEDVPGRMSRFREAEAGESLSLRKAWSSEWVLGWPGLHGETLSLKTNKKRKSRFDLWITEVGRPGEASGMWILEVFHTTYDIRIQFQVLRKYRCPSSKVSFIMASALHNDLQVCALVGSHYAPCVYRSYMKH